MRRQTGSTTPQSAAEAFEMIELATADLSTITRAFDVLAEFVKLPVVETEENTANLQ